MLIINILIYTKNTDGIDNVAIAPSYFLGITIFLTEAGIEFIIVWLKQIPKLKYVTLFGMALIID